MISLYVFGSGIETEGAFDIFILQVAVDGLRASDDLNTGIVCCKVFSQNCSVCIGIVTTDDYDCGNAMLLADFSKQLQTARSVSSFVLPEPMISNPPVFRYSLIYSSSKIR